MRVPITSLKEAVFLSVDVIDVGENGKKKYIVDRLQRSHWLILKSHPEKTIQHFHEGSEKMVWVRYFDEFKNLPTEQESLELMIDYFNHKGIQVNLGDKS